MILLCRKDRARSEAHSLTKKRWYHDGTVGLMAMTLRLTDEQDTRLTELARMQGISKQQAVARLIDAAAERATKDERLRAIAARVKDRDADLLERLAQ